MRIGQHSCARSAFADLGLPACAKARKKRWSPVSPSITFALPCLRLIVLIGGIGHLDPAEIADILAQRQLAVDLGPGIGS